MLVQTGVAEREQATGLASRIVEDIADAAAIFSAARENPWGNAHIRRLAAWAVVALTVLATVLATLVRVRTGQPAGLFTVVEG